MLAALVAAPLAFTSRQHRAAAGFWCGVGFIGLSWQLAVPGFVSLWRLPGFSLCSSNRYVLLTAFSILTVAVMGLDACRQGVTWRGWMWGLGIIGEYLGRVLMNINQKPQYIVRQVQRPGDPPDETQKPPD